MKRQGIMGFVIGLLLGGFIVFVCLVDFVPRPMYEIIPAGNPPCAWVLNKKTGEIYTFAMGQMKMIDEYAKPPYPRPLDPTGHSYILLPPERLQGTVPALRIREPL